MQSQSADNDGYFIRRTTSVSDHILTPTHSCNKLHRYSAKQRFRQKLQDKTCSGHCVQHTVPASYTLRLHDEVNSVKNTTINIFSHIFIVVFLTEFTSPYSLNTQRGWHTSELHFSRSLKKLKVRLLRNY